MKQLRMLKMIIKRTHLDKVLVTFVANLFLVALLIFLIEPDIETYRNSLWYCYVSIATIGYGDIVATTFLGRLLTVYLSLHAILAIALIPGVITSYYMEVVNRREKETVTVFLDKLEHLPELSREELQTIANQVKKIK